MPSRLVPTLLSVVSVLVSQFVFAAFSRADVSRYDVVWDHPSYDSAGSMPLGNGDVTLNVWAEPSGDILFYVAKGDALSEINRLLKLARVRLSLSPDALAAGARFQQALRLATGHIEITYTQRDASRRVLIWPDAHHPLVHVEASGDAPFGLTASVEIWRDEARVLRGNEGLSAMEVAQTKRESADVLVPTTDHSVVWYHRNESVWFENNLRKGGLGHLLGQVPDPMKNRTFGGHLSGPGFTAAPERPATLRRGPATEHRLSLVLHTAQTETADAWLQQLRALAADLRARDLEALRAAHRAHWAEFWERSFLRVRTPAEATARESGFQPSPSPLHLGANHENKHTFRGALAAVRLNRGVLSREELRRRASASPDLAVSSADLLAAWRFDRPASEFVPVAGDRALVARVEGALGAAHGGVKLGENARISVAHSPALALNHAFTLESWVRLDTLAEGGVLFDKSAGGERRRANLLFTLPAPHAVTGHLLYRELPNPTSNIGGTLLHTDSTIPLGRWVHLALAFDPATGRQLHFIDGHLAAETPPEASPDLVAQQWHLQRMMFHAGGRSEFPMRFNGQLFTFASAAYNADYRRWGGAYWMQNTRLLYWPLLATGDHDALRRFFDMYVRALPVARERTRLYYGHDGAYFPETVLSWGAYKEGEVRRRDDGAWFVSNPWIRHYFSGNLELLSLMLDYWRDTRDTAFLASHLLPFATDIIRFYDVHHAREPDGTIRFAPSQALETWQKAVNPANEIAGLRWVLPLLLELPPDSVPAETRAYWREVLARVPELPRRTNRDGRVALAPAAETLEPARNSENPELYAVFPFRLFGRARPELDVALATWERRANKAAFSWQQNDIQAALLGLTDEARGFVLSRSRANRYRFPTFWQHGNDWAPDGCHSGVFMHALQSMALQVVGDKIHVLPAWPKEWDVHFRLRGPDNTVIEVRHENGRLVSAEITPAGERPRLVLPQQ
jgi:hypothetical protein